MRHEPTSGVDDPSLNYRVTWRGVDGNTYERVFEDRDQGWDFYQRKDDTATWEHIPAQ